MATEWNDLTPDILNAAIKSGKMIIADEKSMAALKEKMAKGAAKERGHKDPISELIDGPFGDRIAGGFVVGTDKNGKLNSQMYVGRPPNDLFEEPVPVSSEDVKSKIGQPPTTADADIEWPALKRQLEAQFRIHIADDDPLRDVAALCRLTMQQCNKDAAKVVADHLNGRLDDFRKSLDESTIRRQAETRSEVLRFAEQLRQVFKRDETAAIKELATCARDIQAAAESMKSTRVHRQWLHMVLLTVIGLCFAAGMVLCGYVLAQIR